MMKPTLFILSAPSGAGKTSLCNRLLEELSDQLKLSISHTTRAPRGTEKDGKSYHFITKEQFKKRIEKNDFAEWAEVHGNYYGTSKSEISRILNSNHSVVLEIDVQGAKQLLQEFSGQCVLVFIEPPSIEELEKRIRARGFDSDAAIQVRLKNAITEMKQSDFFQYRIINDQFETAYSKLHQIIQDELNRRNQSE